MEPVLSTPGWGVSRLRVDRVDVVANIDDYAPDQIGMLIDALGAIALNAETAIRCIRAQPGDLRRAAARMQRAAEDVERATKVLRCLQADVVTIASS